MPSWPLLKTGRADRGAPTVRLRSGATREDAHAFYRALGYQEGKAALGSRRPSGRRLKPGGRELSGRRFGDAGQAARHRPARLQVHLPLDDDPLRLR